MAPTNTMLKSQSSFLKADSIMRSAYTSFFILILTLILWSCGAPEEQSTAVIEPIVVDSTAIKIAIQREQDSTFTAFFLQQYIEDLVTEGAGMIRSEVLFSDVMLPELYESYAYQLLWKDSVNIQNAIDAIRAATDDGLDPEDYHLTAIEEFIAQASDDYEIKAGLDILITDGIILYGTHLLNGKTDPKTHEPTLKYEQKVLSEDALKSMRTDLITGDVNKIIQSLRPPSQYYRAMMKGLQFYESLSDSGGWNVVTISERKLVPDSSHRDIPEIRERMLVEGDLPPLDTMIIQDSLYDPLIYDQLLQRSVERYQIRHGLNPDGVIGRGTVAAMNISVQEKIKLLKANMERARWIHHDLDSNYVLVNIAGFDLRLVKGDSVCWSTKVMVGKVATATPVFRDEMQYVEINPEWTVPFSISNDEILPKLKTDPSYLRRNNMSVLTMSGNEVDASKLNFNDYGEKMPYIIRQGPGNGNSLGRIKFLFPNRFMVYLHDTPSKILFARETRAFSHGCIRMQNPFDFAERILAEQGINRSYIDSVYRGGEKLRITLDEYLPVVITYSTAFADADMVYFYEDIYKRDELLQNSLGLSK